MATKSAALPSRKNLSQRIHVDRVSLVSNPPIAPPSHDPDDTIPLIYRLFLWNPELIMQHLKLLYEQGHIEDIPNPWQLTQGVIFYWYRYFFRSSTVGISESDKVKNTVLAKLFKSKLIRTPFLFAAGAIGQKPDITGLGVPVSVKIDHLIGAYHPGDNAIYDLQLVACYPGKLEELRNKLLDVLRKDTDDTRFLRDLAVYENYHARLLEMVEENLKGNFTVGVENAHNPDTSLRVHVRWCCQQAKTPGHTLEAILEGTYSLKPFA